MIPFIDLKAQQDLIREKIDQRIKGVLDHGKYILGPEVAELEERLSSFCGAEHTVTCANGTDAITLVLMAENIGAGDIVFVPSFSFVATAEAPAQLGATPFFVDVAATSFNICPESLRQAIKDARQMGGNPKAIIAVDLFGLPADYEELRKIADAEGLILIADAAQSFGAIYKGKSVGQLADYTTVSFFPAKPLGCYGDGGAVFTNKKDRAECLLSLRFHGKGGYKYDNVRIGLNSRLDTIQAAVLLEKLEIFPRELEQRVALAAKYNHILSDYCITPELNEDKTSSWAQYTIRLDNRDEVVKGLSENNIPAVVYYPIPLHKQIGYQSYLTVSTGLKKSEELAETVMSLPMHPYMEEDELVKITTNLINQIQK
ncbi:DegT/DnrJ/EryC1/StrS family aminotransferase [Curvivirga sp.]|uniref:DegT/DnrJ/EryC1/StrS family aminotransferase n=1 Tax=Curvivirga sp. TaxID=2856848 RepID=UPI003B5CFFD0